MVPKKCWHTETEEFNLHTNKNNEIMVLHYAVPLLKNSYYSIYLNHVIRIEMKTSFLVAITNDFLPAPLDTISHEN